MIAVVQRVTSASVSLLSEPSKLNQINQGYCVLLGVAEGDTETDIGKVVGKLSKLRIFSDSQGKMNLSIAEVKGSILLISQFTLLANISDGNRPSFIKAAAPDLANAYYELVAKKLSTLNIPVKTGFFGEHMVVSIENDGPVTIIIDSKKL